MVTTVTKAAYLGPDGKGRNRAGCCAVIDINGVRFFSLPPKDETDARRINYALAVQDSVQASVAKLL